ncbi:FtsX-like permease family protein [Mucilaginibacter psychrotolerans]|uniref:FtsX-like permease family protein n=1 Tax=Mucilaginibacter psychrotolerans TaxID=1524096 RepID=A0A4Y8SJG7_9SPHI|nr:FtsX-like permease family protein [Mucilaginibacter psychrotolerans]TFF39213.1 FtsX-like permease family protein [Mucilaginibacter psychrotolerans]
MIKNYLKTAWRNLLQNKATSFISVAGLAVGICCFLLLATYLINELRYDRFHKKADSIVRIIQNHKSPNLAEVNSVAVTPTAPVPVFKQQIAEVADGVRIVDYSDMRPAVVQYGDKLFKEKHVLMADESFFKLFDFKFIAGDARNAFGNSSSIVITASTAKKYFGADDPIGKILKVDQTNNMMVTGVVEDVPEYSQLKFDMIGSYAMMPRSLTRQWDSANDYSYLLLKPGADRASAEKKINTYLDNLFKGNVAAGEKIWYTLEPLTSVHLYSTAGGLEPGGNIKYIYILGVVAVILLVLACVNFLNLVTARSAERSKEIGVRKVMGAQRKQLFFQFITEAGIITLVSLLAGVAFASLSFPSFSNFSGQSLSFDTWNLDWLVAAVVGLFFIVTLLAGTYPSLYLSAFKPVVILKTKSTGAAGGNTLRKSLVVFQFVVSVFFIISTLIAGNQLRYMQNLNTGMDRSQVMVLDIGGMPYNKLEPFKNAIAQQPGITGATASYNSPVNVTGGYSINSADGKSSDFNLPVTATPVERSFIKTMGMTLVAGRDLDLGDEQQVQKDSLRQYSFILNETAVAAMGWKPAQAIGKRMGLNGRLGTIKAVAKDFNFTSLHSKIEPLVVFPEYDWFGKLLVKTEGKNTASTIASVETQWHKFYPDAPFEYHFLDQEFEGMYKTDQRTGAILKAFTLVTVFISCLGLFGLAVFSTRQRVKEIGIRKVLGANVMSIVGLISSDFLKLVLIAVVISSPLAWYAMSEWLQDFAFRIEISWWVFALAGGMAIVIAFITVGYQSVKAALSNPVKSLRSE